MIISSEKNLQSYLTHKASIENRGIEGRGIFAIHPIEKGEVVAIRGGEIVSRDEYFLLSSDIRGVGLQVDENLYIIQSDTNEGSALLNHSCEPNCGIKGQISFVAMRDIAAGEELTFDYAMAFNDDQDFICSCGTPSCRTRILGNDHAILDVRRKYSGHFSQYLEKKHASIIDDRAFLQQFEATGAWGIVTALDLHDCNPEIIRSADKIREFTYEVCDRIKVKRFGEPTIVHFGQDDRVAGYSLVQLIETSLVSGHFANLTNRVYLDIFSCAFYSPTDAAEYAASFFEAKRFNIKTYLRH
ncbi:MAG: S-adenosylmethionine decarboxylase [Spirochaetia bacterium]|nr:S-adenosylmethionine decarboxylase [Spirochaetia bacterium]